MQDGEQRNYKLRGNTVAISFRSQSLKLALSVIKVKEVHTKLAYCWDYPISDSWRKNQLFFALLNDLLAEYILI